VVDTITKIATLFGELAGVSFSVKQFISGAKMAKRHFRQEQQEAEAAPAERPTQKRALAEALRRLGPEASYSALAQFVQEQFGMELAFYILVPRPRATTKTAVPPVARKRCA
jgi:hypothetical protein